MRTGTRAIGLALCLATICGTWASCGSNDGIPDPLAAYTNQTLEWQTCGQPFRETIGSHFSAELEKLGSRATCALMRAPLDYADPVKGDVQIALLRVAAEDPRQRLGAILFNPGGPGGDGLYLSIAFGAQWSAADTADPVKALYKQMARQYDLIGFSPRGTGASTNLTCPSEDSFRFDSMIAVDDSLANFDNVLHNSRLIAENCAKNPQTPYMNSETTARDLDMVRHLLGDDKFNYIGYSYGTWLGTWYAGLFPERVGRMLLIGNADITAPLNDVLIPQGQGMQRVMDEMLAAYASRHPDRFRLGGTVEDVKQAYLSLGIPVPRHLLAATAESLMNTISKATEADRTLFTLRAAQMMQEYLAANPGAGEDDVKAWIEGAQFVPDGEFNKLARAKALDLNGSYFSKVRHETEKAALTGQDALQWAVMCNDSGTRLGVDEWIGENRNSAALYPLFGGFWPRNACLYWPKQTAQRPAVSAVADAGPIMMVQTELDPWTPLSGAMKTFSVLPNVSMILVQKEYSHTLLFPYGAECVDRPVAEYFLYGKQPDRLTTCIGNPLTADTGGQ